jgi:hypothetical protein
MGLACAPASALAAKPSTTDRQNAAKECRAERGSSAATREAFKHWGTNKNKKNAFGKCVSARARAEQRQTIAAVTNAAKECMAERALNPAAFALKYGTNNPNAKYPNPGNAFGKCVSGKAKAKKQSADAADARAIAKRKRAARSCATERTDIGRAAFGMKYGTVKSKRHNAFGKCVSKKARA